MSDDASPVKQATGRKRAEWVTLGLSALLVSGVAAHLVYEALRDAPPLVPVEVRVLSEQAQEKGGRHVVPVEVRNQGRQTLKDLVLQVTSRSPGEEPQSSDVLIDYLGRGASQKVYLYLDRHPTSAELEVKPLSYQLE